MSRRPSLGPLVAVVAFSLASCSSASTGAGLGTATPTPSPALSSSPNAGSTAAAALTTPPASTATGLPAPGTPTVYETASLGPAFDLPLTLTLPPGWKALDAGPSGAGAPAGTLGFVHVGNPPTDQSQWWGAGLMLVDGAHVVDPSLISTPASPGDPQRPWPEDYIRYLVSLPGVRVVEGPEAVTIGGAEGTQVIVTTPPMHPTIYLKGDTAWLGGGPSGLDPAFTRQIAELMVDGKRLLVEFDDDPAKFVADYTLVRRIYDSIVFGK